MSKASKFAIKFGASSSSMMLGFSPKKINTSTFNYSSKGYYLLVDGGGYLYSQRGDNDKHMFDSCEITQGTIYGAKYDKKKKTISYYKGTQFLGIGYNDVKLKKKEDELFPALEFTTANMVVDIVKPKFK